MPIASLSGRLEEQLAPLGCTVDVIVEGKITNEEGIDEVLQTIVELKNVASPVLRINCLDARFQGKIGFAQGGYILGGKIDDTGELGYPAIRRLLSVRNGNYAILDPEKQIIADINQSLWLDGEKIIHLLPNLPESPEPLAAAHPSAATSTFTGEALEELTMVRKTPERASASVGGVNSRARQFNPGSWRYRYGTLILWIILLVLVGAGLYQYSDRIMPYVQNVIK